MTIKVCTIIFLQGINVRVKYLNYSLINVYVILTIFCQLQYFLSTIVFVKYNIYKNKIFHDRLTTIIS